MADTFKAPKNVKVRQTSAVRFSEVGYVYVEKGRSGEQRGLVPFYTTSGRPDPSEVPYGTLSYNVDLDLLEISKPNGSWTPVTSGISSTFSGTSSDIELGTPTDGNYTDGAITLTATTKVADAIDLINEYIATISGGSTDLASGTLNDTLRFDGNDWVPNSALQTDGTDVSISNKLTVQGSFIVTSGTPPSGSSDPSGEVGEYRWDGDYMYVKTPLGWARSILAYF